MKTVFARVESTLRVMPERLWSWLKPEAHSWQGAGSAALVTGALIYTAWLLFMLPGSPAVHAALAAVYALLGLLAVLGFQLVSLVIGWLNRLPDRFRWMWLTGAFLVALTMLNLRPPALVLAAVLVMLPAALLGGSAWVLLRARLVPGDQPQSPARRAAQMLGALLGAAGLLAVLLWFAGSGLDPRPQVVAAQTGAPLASITLENPAVPGPYVVETLTYGSGLDRFRPEYGEQAALKTSPVDGSHLLASTWQGPSRSIRALFWGFDPTALPLNGRVWYPQDGPSAGPYPLVLVVHGNHEMFDFSDSGYDYLGELLASRGFILVSVDQNFLNGGLIDLFDKTLNENDARGWLLLEHLRAWHAWNVDPANPFYQLVDTGRIALIGHSRGGEAAALAAAFNRLPAFPENAAQVFDYNYVIRAVLAIAPSDGQYRPAGRGTQLADIDYLVLHGTHDADVSSFDGIKQFERVQLSPGSDAFKAALYIYRANHGQFNRSWQHDMRAFASGFLNHKPLLSTAEQQQVASVYISAFLEASLRGQRGYRPIFQDARAAGEGWLPDTIYLNRYAEAGEQTLAGYEEDINLRTASLAGSTIAAEGLVLWQEGRIPTRRGSGETNVVTLGWDESQPASYTIHLPQDLPPVDPAGVLVFSLADALRDPYTESGGPRQPIDLSVVLVDAAGQAARLPLSTRMPVQPQLVVDVWKAPIFYGHAQSEAVLQSYVFALTEFAAANPAFDPASIRAVRFVFDRSPAGSILLDEVAFR
jgi:dienelactone hydrolase